MMISTAVVRNLRISPKDSDGTTGHEVLRAALPVDAKTLTEYKESSSSLAVADQGTLQAGASARETAEAPAGHPRYNEITATWINQFLKLMKLRRRHIVCLMGKVRSPRDLPAARSLVSSVVYACGHGVQQKRVAGKTLMSYLEIGLLSTEAVANASRNCWLRRSVCAEQGRAATQGDRPAQRDWHSLAEMVHPQLADDESLRTYAILLGRTSAALMSGTSIPFWLVRGTPHHIGFTLDTRAQPRSFPFCACRSAEPYEVGPPEDAKSESSFRRCL